MNNRALQWLQSTLFEGERKHAGVVLASICLAAGVIAGAYVALLSPTLALAATAALVLGILMLRSTQWGLFALVGVACLLPFAAMPIQIGFRPTFLDVVKLLLYVVWLASYAAGHRRKLVATPLGWAVALFMALACASFIAGLSHSSATSYVIRHFAEILMAIAILFVLVNNVVTPRQLNNLSLVTMFSGVAAAGIGIFLYIIPPEWAIRLLSALGRFNYPTGSGILRYIEDDPEQPMRAIGTSVDPNVLGGLMILIGGLVAAQLFASRPLLKRWMALGMMGAVALCLYLTYSRAAMLGFAVSLAILGILRYRRLVLFMALAGILLLALPQTQNYVTHFIQGLRGQDLATQMRFGEYKDAFILISRYPWFGVGFAGTPDIDTYLGVSSAYLLMAQQMGFVGVSVFLLIIGKFYTYTLGAWRRLSHHDPLEPVLLGTVASLSGALVAGILDHYFFNFDFPHSVTLFWLFVGMGAAGAQIARSRPSRDAGQDIEDSRIQSGPR